MTLDQLVKREKIFSEIEKMFNRKDEECVKAVYKLLEKHKELELKKNCEEEKVKDVIAKAIEASRERERKLRKLASDSDNSGYSTAQTALKLTVDETRFREALALAEVERLQESLSTVRRNHADRVGDLAKATTELSALRAELDDRDGRPGERS